MKGADVECGLVGCRHAEQMEDALVGFKRLSTALRRSADRETFICARKKEKTNQKCSERKHEENPHYGNHMSESRLRQTLRL